MLDSRLGGGAWEREYIAEIFSHLPSVEACVFHYTQSPDGKPIVPEVGENVVLVMLSEECSRPTPKVPCRLFCRQYARTWDEPDVFHFPLGTMAGFPSSVSPFSARPIDVSFIGTPHSARKPLIEGLKEHSGLKAYRTRFGFEKVPLAEYAAVLNDSKVAICLGGGISPETFRFYEATRMGCVTINPKYMSGWLYDDSSMIQLKDMTVDAIVDEVRGVLDDGERAEFLHRAALCAWESKFAPYAVAERIRRVLRQRGCP
jgi:hypothetical protein